jgi:hypothetical protein
MNSRGVALVYRSTMASQTTRTLASKTNRLFTLFASLFFIAAITAPFLDISKQLDTTATEPLISIAPDPEFEKIVASPYPFPQGVPSRDAALLPHTFKYGIFQTPNMTGMDAPEFISHFYPMSKKGLDCSGWWSTPLACSVAHSTSGDFLFVIQHASQSANDEMQIDSIDVDLYVPTVKGTTSFASTVLQANFSISRCEYGAYSGSITLDKVKVGDSEVFVFSLYGGFIDSIDLNSEEQRNPTHQIVFASNESGMPEIVASYAGSELIQIAATDRSLLLTYGDGSIEKEEINGYTAGNIIELLPHSGGWKERIHRVASTRDPLWVIGYGLGLEGTREPNLVKPERLLSYDANLYPDPDTQPICRN